MEDNRAIYTDLSFTHGKQVLGNFRYRSESGEVNAYFRLLRKFYTKLGDEIERSGRQTEALE